MANDMRTRLLLLVTPVVVVGSMLGTASAAADDTACSSVGQYCSFYSPSRNISCEINTGGRVGQDSVYCQTVTPPQSVTMDPTGAFQSCSGVSCLGNPGQGTATLPYGQSRALGPFQCLSGENGVTCTAAGRGFLISRSGIATAG